MCNALCAAQSHRVRVPLRLHARSTVLLPCDGDVHVASPDSRVRIRARGTHSAYTRYHIRIRLVLRIALCTVGLCRAGERGLILEELTNAGHHHRAEKEARQKPHSLSRSRLNSRH